MNSDSGFGSSGAPFEYAVAEANNKALKTKKALFIVGYVLYAAIILGLGAGSKIFLPLMCFIPLSLWIIVWLTWRFTQVEYEYSFFSGELTVNRILGNRTRKNLTKVRIQNFSAIFPATELNQSKIEAFAAENTIFAVSEAGAEGIWVALWDDAESGKHQALYFEPNEKAIKILKYYNASAMAK
ncbi:MAG: hypothetical protein E7584_05310 [Ruminococcaceae bacterium]|nr:hypothetical protein [Oscillospiraceae bacterium]